MNKFVRTKSHTGSKFSKTSLWLLCTWWIVVVHLYCVFMWHQMAPQQTAKFRTSFFGQFFTSLRKDSVANYAWIWTQLHPYNRYLCDNILPVLHCLRGDAFVSCVLIVLCFVNLLAIKSMELQL